MKISFSELYGRRLPLVIASFGFSIFNLAVATGKDLQTVMICRFFSGFFGACPLTVSILVQFHRRKLTFFSVWLQCFLTCLTIALAVWQLRYLV